ncbi:MAG TPA: NYN domain-containing protein [Rhabdochlamydiaceae bacterium]|nr:NYN domain-containing protein [Rhabdochlamydiaceae bacterium]HSX13093.1 NYN domain-containing protein [Chlamydiales bacterium]
MHYFIDGYNLLFRLLGDPRPLQKNRQKIIASINERIAELKLNVTLVFDGSRQGESENTRGHFDVLEVIYTSKTSSADDYILKEIEFSSRPSQETVITSDMELARRCRSLGAKTQTIEGFLAWIAKKEKKTRSRKTQSVQKAFKDSDRNISRLLELFEKRLLEDLQNEEDS